MHLWFFFLLSLEKERPFLGRSWPWESHLALLSLRSFFCNLNPVFTQLLNKYFSSLYSVAGSGLVKNPCFGPWPGSHHSQFQSMPVPELENRKMICARPQVAYRTSSLAETTAGIGANLGRQREHWDWGWTDLDLDPNSAIHWFVTWNQLVRFSELIFLIY